MAYVLTRDDGFCKLSVLDAYEKKVDEWRNSSELKSLETEINNYNMSKWQEIQEQANQTTHS